MKTVILSEACELNPRHQLKGADLNTCVSFVAMAQISEQTCSITSEVERPLSEVAKGYTHFANGDLLIAKITPCYENGKTAVAKIQHDLGFGSTEFHVLRPNPKLLRADFLFYLLRSPFIREEGSRRMTGSAGQKRVPMKFFAELGIPLPSLDEQVRIVSLLNEADVMRHKRRKAIKLLDEYIESVFVYKFEKENGSWSVPMVKLGDITTKITDGVHAKPKYTDSGTPFISVKDISSKRLKFDECKFISRDDHENYIRRCKPEINDILYTKVGTYGKACIVDTDREFSLYVSVALLKPKFDIIDPVFLTAVLNHPFIKRQADKAIKGIGVPDLHLIEIKSFNIPLPSIDDQRNFAAEVREINLIKTKMEHQEQELNRQFNALMQKAFAGVL